MIILIKIIVNYIIFLLMSLRVFAMEKPGQEESWDLPAIGPSDEFWNSLPELEDDTEHATMFETIVARAVAEEPPLKKVKVTVTFKKTRTKVFTKTQLVLTNSSLVKDNDGPSKAIVLSCKVITRYFENGAKTITDLVSKDLSEDEFVELLPELREKLAEYTHRLKKYRKISILPSCARLNTAEHLLGMKKLCELFETHTC